jgi:hypothetical protein
LKAIKIYIKHDLKRVSVTSITTGCHPSFSKSSKLVFIPAATMAITSNDRDVSVAKLER